MPKVYKLRDYPDPILHEVSQPVTDFNTALKDLVDSMYAVMQLAGGYGISAVQIGALHRVIIVNELTMVNPEITDMSIGEQFHEEGCLSVPGVYEKRARAKYITCKYQSVTGEEYEFDFEGLPAFCIQHEIDHLDGKVFIDELSPLKKKRARSKIQNTVRKFGRDIMKQKVY